MINSIIAEISNNKDYENICKSLVKSDEWQDLWHDVIIRLYEKESHIIKAKEGGYLRNYLIVIIYQVFNSNCRKEKNNPIINCELKDCTEIEDFFWDKKEYDYFKRTELDEKAVEITKEAVNEVTKMMMQGDSGAMILWQASQSNVYTVSRRLGTSSYQVNKTIKPIIKQIKRKLK